MTTNDQVASSARSRTDDPYRYGDTDQVTASPAIPAWDAPDPYSPALQPYAPPAPAYPPLGGYGSAAPAPHGTVNVSVGGPVIVAPPTVGMPIIVRALWFLCIGWWLSWFAITAAYLLLVTIVGMPLGFALLNKIPQITTLRPRNQVLSVTNRNGVTTMAYAHQAQYPMWLRVPYFLVVGWWAGLLWLYTAWVLQLLIVTIPVSILMYDRAPGVITLHRH